MAEPKDEGAGYAGCVVLLLTPAIYVVWALCAVQMWRWFVVPLAPSLPTIRPSVAVGLLEIWYLVRGYRTPDKKLDEAKGQTLVAIAIARGIIYPLGCLVIGYIAFRIGGAS